jgi:chemotaxis protein CheC
MVKTMTANFDQDLEAIAKIFSVGANKAAASLGALVQRQITLSVPNYSIIQAIDLVSELCMTTDSVTGVFKWIKEPLDSYAVILIPKRESQELVRFVVPSSPSEEDAAQLTADAITEIGNILIGTCLGSVADTFGISINLDLPVMYVENPSDFFLHSIVVDDLCEYFLDIRIKMTVHGTSMTFFWDFLLPDNSLEFLKHHQVHT